MRIQEKPKASDRAGRPYRKPLRESAPRYPVRLAFNWSIPNTLACRTPLGSSTGPGAEGGSRAESDTVGAMLFDFSLLPLDEIKPWGKPGTLSLHWFGLTDGHYWMDVGQSTLFEYNEAARQLGAPRYCNYQVARQYEDVVEALPHIMEPVPADLMPYLSGEGRWRTTDCMAAWSEAQPERDDDYWSTVEDAVTWIGRRELSTAHLSPSVDFVMWSDDEAVHIEWDNRAKLLQGVPAWSAAYGTYRLPREQFAEEVRTFHERLMRAMAERVESVVAGALPSEVRVDIPGLLREQKMRASLSDTNFGPPPAATDWGAVRQAIKTIYA